MCRVCVDGCGSDSEEAEHGEESRVDTIMEVEELGEGTRSENGGEDEQVRSLFVFVSPDLSLDHSLLSSLSTLSHTKFSASFGKCLLKEFFRNKQGRKRKFYKQFFSVPASVPVLRWNRRGNPRLPVAVHANLIEIWGGGFQGF